MADGHFRARLITDEDKQGSGAKLLTYEGASASVGMALIVGPGGGAVASTGSALDTVLSVKGGLITFNGTGAVQLSPGADGAYLTTDSTQVDGLSYTRPLHRLAFNYQGTVPALATFPIYKFMDSANYLANMAGSQASIFGTPAATRTFTLMKNGASIGTVSFSTSGAPTWSLASGNFAVGDELSVVTPAIVDFTMLYLSFYIYR